MRRSSLPLIVFASVCCFTLASCTGGVGTTCFQDDECDSGLICCHLGSPFTQGSCQTEMVCNDMGGGTGGVGGSGAASGSGGTVGQGGESGSGGSAGAGGRAGSGGAGGDGGGGTSGQGGGAAGTGGTGGT